jgi:DNA-binding NarL/FixJ family response regulator
VPKFKTVVSHKASMMDKLGIRDAVGLARFAALKGPIT